MEARQEIKFHGDHGRVTSRPSGHARPDPCGIDDRARIGTALDSAMIVTLLNGAAVPQMFSRLVDGSQEGGGQDNVDGLHAVLSFNDG
ncbi:hypothetical protein DHEL01_v206855 [Diaporthe helianthi]|uniref:Uncharacterized protein n=1 Tax=Diaporthe helianthi TaxID=158607 RepID=A0A2P5HWW1_DIAHE|nr:hypothetical protein DHEL01_v206855 [Diaporthe helianthi]